jgi:hypothetical protein
MIWKDKWTDVYQIILTKKFGESINDLSKEQLANILSSMNMLRDYCLAPTDECDEIYKKLNG